MFYFNLFLIFLTILRSHVNAADVAINGCPNLDFTWHMANQNILQYTMDITNVNYIENNLFEITIHVVGAETIPLKYLYSLKIIGVNGPKGTVQLYGKNENTYLIDNPTDFTSTFQVYGNLKDCKWWLPNFQIQFEYMQGDASQYWQTWTWGTSTFDLSTGCNNYDNQGHSQTDFPGFYWTVNLPEQCHPKRPSSRSCSSSSSIISSSPTSSFTQVSSSTNQFSTLISTEMTSSSIYQSAESSSSYQSSITSDVISTSQIISSSSSISSEHTSTPLSSGSSSQSASSIIFSSSVASSSEPIESSKTSSSTVAVSSTYIESSKIVSSSSSSPMIIYSSVTGTFELRESSKSVSTSSTSTSELNKGSMTMSPSVSSISQPTESFRTLSSSPVTESTTKTLVTSMTTQPKLSSHVANPSLTDITLLTAVSTISSNRSTNVPLISGFSSVTPLATSSETGTRYTTPTVHIAISDSTLSSISKTVIHTVPTVTTTSLYPAVNQDNSGIKPLFSLINIYLIVFVSQLL